MSVALSNTQNNRCKHSDHEEHAKNITHKTTRCRYWSSDWLSEAAAQVVLHPSISLIGCRPFNERTDLRSISCCVLVPVTVEVIVLVK